MRKIQSENLKIVMDNRQIIGKLRECAKGLLDVARGLQRSERVEGPQSSPFDNYRLTEDEPGEIMG